MKTTLIFLLLFIQNREPKAWELSVNKDGIAVYTSAMPNTKIKGVKAEMEFQANLAQVIAVIMDVDTYHEWVYQCSYSKVLKQVSKHEMIYYHITNAPWPVSPRDLVSHFKISIDERQQVEIQSHSLPEYVPEKSNMVRVKNTYGSWKITALPGGKVKAVYQLQLDPGGNIPAWAINWFITSGPFNTFTKMRERVKLPKYLHAKMSDFY